MSGGAVLFEALDLTISRSSHTSLDFSSLPLVGSTLVIRVDARSLQGRSDDIAIDNVRFAQALVVPEPHASLLLGFGLIVLCGFRPGHVAGIDLEGNVV